MAGRGFNQNEKGYLFINDMANNKFVTFDLKRLALNKPVLPESQMYLPTNFVLKFNIVHKISNQLYWITYSGNDRKGRFAIYNSENKSIKWIPYFPKSDVVISSKDLPFYYYSYTSANDSLHEVAAAMKFFKRVEFYDSNGTLIKSNVFKPFDEFLPPYKRSFSEDPNTKIFYNESYAGKKYFYCTCVNESETDYVKNKGHIQVHIFDWNGNLKKIVALDKMFLGFFAVDESTMQLYITSYVDADKENNILQYDLKKLKI